MMGAVKVASLATAKQTKRRYDAVLTIEDPGLRHGLRFHSSPHPDQLVLMFEDVDEPVPGIALPHELHVEAALSFGREHADGSLLVHCRAGVSRSAAIALGIIADRLGTGSERKAVAALLMNRPVAKPNLIVLELADTLLERGGKLIDAWREVESSRPAYAEHRTLKRMTVKKQPWLYSPERPLTATAFRIPPQTLRPVPVIPSGTSAPLPA